MTASTSKSDNAGNQQPSALDAIQTDAATMQRRFVRIVKKQPNGLVAFEFSVGWPDMACELVLPEELFNEFCIKNQVEFLTEAVGEKLGENNVEY